MLSGKVNSENFIVIHGWMRTELGLKGNELLTYALIYGFSQDGRSEFQGGLEYIADWTGTTKRTTITVLASLVEKGLLIKRDIFMAKNVKNVGYRAVKKFHRGGEKTSLGAVKKFHRGGEKTSPNNIINNLFNNIDKGCEGFTPPTLTDIKEYCREKGYTFDADHFYNYYQSTGWMAGKTKIRDWKAKVDDWVAKDRTDQKRRPANNRWNDFPQDEHDWDELEQKLMEMQHSGNI